MQDNLNFKVHMTRKNNTRNKKISSFFNCTSYLFRIGTIMEILIRALSKIMLEIFQPLPDLEGLGLTIVILLALEFMVLMFLIMITQVYAKMGLKVNVASKEDPSKYFRDDDANRDLPNGY